MDRAETPRDPFSPQPRKNLIIAIVLGLILGSAVALGIDYLDDTIRTPEDITRKLKLPFLGLVPAVRGERSPLLSGKVPHDFGEAFRGLRTSLVFTSGGGEGARVVLVTSAQPLEGKTTTACNLAIALALGGNRVLLIDADMRRPGVHRAMGIKNEMGLSHLLSGQARAREAMQKTSVSNLWVMPAGKVPPNPSELLSSERMKQLVANLSQGPFDWVFIDTPPVLAVSDALTLTPLASGVTYVVGAEMTRPRLAERAIEMILSVQPRFLGAILNRVDFDRNKYYYSRYYGYQYASYYQTSSAA
jgi:capsular exopolysaccharide synthesis family protein